MVNVLWTFVCSDIWWQEVSTCVLISRCKDYIHFAIAKYFPAPKFYCLLLIPRKTCNPLTFVTRNSLYFVNTTHKPYLKTRTS